MMTATEIEQACYGVSPQARVDILTKWQLCVMREGMRRAANLSSPANEDWTSGSAGSARGTSNKIRQYILTAAEQLTEKDL